MNGEPDLQVIERMAGEAITIEGDLTEANAEEFERRISELVQKSQREIALDLHGLDIDDGVALATFINLLRRLRAQTACIVLRGAPQMLCHNLYRVGMLDDGAIELVDMRLDEPSGI